MKNSTNQVTKGLSEWAGVYSTTTQWWGSYFAPLIIHADGQTVELAGTPLTFTYDNNKLSFDWQPIKGTTAKGLNIDFKVEDSGLNSFSGEIHPRPQDLLPVEFTGQQVTDPEVTYLLARKSLMAEFFDPYVTSDIINEIGWDENYKKAAEKFENLKKIVTSQNGYYDNPWEANWFMSVREKIEDTKLFKCLKKMPKGAILHIHPTAMGSYEKLLEDAAAYKSGDNMFYVSEDYREAPPGSLFVFEKQPPAGYISLDDAWKDDQLRKKVLATLVLTDEDKNYEGDIWELFEPVFARVGQLLSQPDLKSSYYKQAFEYLAKDNVSHVELRTRWDPANEDKEGTNENIVLKALDGLELSMNAIWSDSRVFGKSSDISDDIVKVGKIMKDPTGGKVIGFDLVGEEDKGETTLYFLDNLINAYKNLECTLPPMFFHDGESDLPPEYAYGLKGTPSSEGFNNNLVDAYLMNTLTLPDFTFTTTRVGHGLELFKTPGLARKFKEAGICIELCPISNQLLRYMLDLREHPGQAYLAQGIPVSLNPDDPAIYGYQGVTHDFWEACIAWDLDLLSLKVLAYYSLKHSGLQGAPKETAIKNWRKEWVKFMELVIKSNT